MRARSWWAILPTALAIVGLGATQARADEVPAEYRAAIKKGLEWMARNQMKDGHWESFGQQHAVVLTSVGGMSLLCEGSTIRDGKYKDNVRRAVDWMLQRTLPNGMIGNPREGGSYMYGHGFGMLFLASVVGEEEEGERRKKLVEVLEKAAKFSAFAQTNRGGWGYVSASDGNNFDEGSVTVTQMQGLRAIRNAGIAVPKDAIERGMKYLKDSTNDQGGVIYSLGGGGGGDGRPALTAAAIACGMSAGDYNSPLVKKWFKFTQGHVGGLGGARFGHDEYTHYYLAQAIYMLGENGYAKLFPDSKPDDRLRWSVYRKNNFETFLRTQQADGSWTGGQVGPVFITGVYLTIMQLDNAVLPIYMR